MGELPPDPLDGTTIGFTADGMTINGVPATTADLAERFRADGAVAYTDLDGNVLGAAFPGSACEALEQRFPHATPDPLRAWRVTLTDPTTGREDVVTVAAYSWMRAPELAVDVAAARLGILSRDYGRGPDGLDCRTEEVPL